MKMCREVAPGDDADDGVGIATTTDDGEVTETQTRKCDPRNGDGDVGAKAHGGDVHENG